MARPPPLDDGGTGGALARVRLELAQASGRRRLDIILDAPDPGALVRALPADELYFTIRDIGLADAGELVRLASPSQFRTFLDLDAWRRGAFDAERALPWLRAGRAGAPGDDALAARWRRKLAALDAELVDLVLFGALVVHDLEENDDPEVESDRTLRSPEGRFLLEFRVDGVAYTAVRGLVDDLYAEDPFRAIRALQALRSELPSELEESALRWRTARLHDLGFPPLEEALSWFARPRVGARRMPGAPGRPPGFLLALRPGDALLGRAAARLPAEDREAAELELVTAANAVLVADGVDPGDLEAVQAAVAAARGLVELGLDALAGGDEARAAEALATTPVKTIFQEGFGRVLALRWRAEALLRRRPGPLGPPLDELLAALARKRPHHFPGVELPREQWGSAAAGAFEERAFHSVGDLAAAEAALRAAEEMVGN